MTHGFANLLRERPRPTKNSLMPCAMLPAWLPLTLNYPKPESQTPTPQSEANRPNLTPQKPEVLNPNSANSLTVTAPSSKHEKPQILSTKAILKSEPHPGPASHPREAAFGRPSTLLGCSAEPPSLPLDLHKGIWGLGFRV